MHKRIPILLGFIIVALAVWIQLTSVAVVQSALLRIEEVAYDMQLRTKVLLDKKFTDSPVVIVDIDDKSLTKEGRWPWPRSKLAELIRLLQEQGAVVIAFDMLFPEKETNIAETVWDALVKKDPAITRVEALYKAITPSFDNDALFADSLKTLDVVLGMTFNPLKAREGILPPPIVTLATPAEKQLGFITAPGYVADIPILQSAAKNAGFLNVFPDPDGIVRRVPLLIRYGDGLYPSLALEAVRTFLLTNIKLNVADYGDSSSIEGIQLGKNLILTDHKAQVIIPFIGRSYTFPFISATDVMHKNIPPDALAGKIVFVGTSATGLGDLHATAIQAVYPGVEIQASIAYGLLENNFSFKPAWSVGAEISVTIVVGLICIFMIPLFGPRMLGILIFLIPTVLVLINNWIWNKSGLIISIVIPIALAIVLALVNIIYGYLFETRRREHLKTMFGQYVPEEHIDEMLMSGGNYGLYGDDRDMTVLFADIRNFTTISEPLSATQLKDMLNEFFTPMTEIIFRHHGTIDKYVGDMIMAFWGAPLKDLHHATNAMHAALDMQKAVIKLQDEFAERGLPEINIGIGLNTGNMSVGDMGSEFRRNYTVLGDEVNLASRIEGLTKHYGVKIMVGENMILQDKEIFLFRKLDRVRVKGKQKGLEIYELVGRKAECSAEMMAEISASDIALDLYFKQEWKEAKKHFLNLKHQYEDVKLYHLLLKRIEEFQKAPPPPEWDGVYVHTTK